MSDTTAVLDRFRHKIAQLRKRYSDGDACCMDFSSHQFAAGSPMPEASIAAFEREHGINFPNQYRSFLATFGNTNVGPSLHFNNHEEAITPDSRLPFPLKSPFLGACSIAHQAIPQSQQWDDLKRLMTEWDSIPKTQGVLNIADYGCALYCVLILNGPYSGHVWVLSGDAAYYGPFGGSEALHDELSTAWTPTDTPEDYTFFEWYEHWLDSALRN